MLDQVAAERRQNRFALRPAEEDLGDSIETCEGDEGFGGVFAGDEPGFEVKVAGEVQVFLNDFALWIGQMAEVAFRGDENGEALALQIIRDALAAADDGGRGGVGRNVDEHFFARIVTGAIDFVSGLAKGEFA